MVWYVALVAILNLGLGYALAVYLGDRSPASGRISRRIGDSLCVERCSAATINLTAEYGGDVATTEAAEMQPSSDTTNGRFGNCGCPTGRRH